MKRRLSSILRHLHNRHALRIGIGISTRQVIADYSGTQRRASYTCVGDTVNLIARLEAYTKVAHMLILIDETTCQSLSDTIKVENIGPADIKRENQEEKIYSVPVG